MLGLIRPTAGSVRLFGRDPQAGVAALDGVAGFVEAPRFYPYLTGRRNLELCAAFDGDGAAGRIDEVLDTVELSDRAKDNVGGYSHGMRQRLGIAAALLRRPRLLLLDEPATGLDPAGMRDMRLLVRRLADERHDGPALEPPARRGRGAVQPRRDRAPRDDRLRGHARRAAAHGGHGLPAAHDRRRARAGGLPAPARDRRRRGSATGGRRVPRPDEAAGRRAVAGAGRGGRARPRAGPEPGTLEDLFFSLTEGDGANGAAAAAPTAGRGRGAAA